jgi:hypothetical protein
MTLLLVQILDFMSPSYRTPRRPRQVQRNVSLWPRQWLDLRSANRINNFDAARLPRAAAAHCCTWRSPFPRSGARGVASRAAEQAGQGRGCHDPDLADLVGDPRLANLHKDPRWLPFLRKIGKAPEQLVAIKFDVTVPK